ncbi:hypothetical protein C5E51_36390 [Nocardia nova]|nr:hypothetical protein C5E51_36390 [Nocardia nova]PPJ02697.1 hypothetical protein C5E44_35120 [Nocardia nova]
MRGAGAPEFPEAAALSLALMLGVSDGGNVLSDIVFRLLVKRAVTECRSWRDGMSLAVAG